jgi:hypothetical protein
MLQIISIIQESNQTSSHEFVTVDQCTWGAKYLSHPSYVFMNRLCPSSIAKFPAVEEGTCPVSEWSEWSPCETPCGKSTR